MLIDTTRTSNVVSLFIFLPRRFHPRTPTRGARSYENMKFRAAYVSQIRNSATIIVETGCHLLLTEASKVGKNASRGDLFDRSPLDPLPNDQGFHPWTHALR